MSCRRLGIGRGAMLQQQQHAPLSACTCAARFAAVPNQSGQYRRVVEVLAQPMQEPYLANTKHGFRRGKPGTYLIQELEPEEGKTECYQWWLSPQQFRKAYAEQWVCAGRVATG